MIVTVDTQILIWGVRQVADDGDEDRIEPCVALFDYLQKRGTRVVLTAPAVAEYLVGGTPEERTEELASLTRKYRVIRFDTKAAKIAAELRSDPDFIRSLGDGAKKTRNAVKADIQIVAAAMAGDVAQIFSDDNDIRNICRRARYSCRGIPTLEDLKGPKSKAGDLFRDSPPEVE